MPRHRIEAPRQRTLWPAAVQSARRVQFRAAGRRGTPGHAKPAVAPEWRQRLTRNQRRMLQRAGRRLLVSPWFAAGAGVVIATGVMVYIPHANFAIDIQQCKLVSCTKLTPEAPAPLQVGTGSRVTAPPLAPSPIAGMTFRYQVVSQSTQFGFSMVIAISAPHSIGGWRLSFVIPGATGVFVVPGEASWEPSGTSGGTASNLLSGTEAAGFAAIAGHQNDSFGWYGQNGDTVRLQVRGDGTPEPPADCTYNGVSCTFTRSHDLIPPQWPGSP